MIKQEKKPKKLFSKMSLAVLFLVIVGGICVLMIKGPVSPTDKIFYSDDDGKSWFADTARPAPFDHGGKEAVRCYLFQENGNPTVKYLLKYAPEVRDAFTNKTAISDSAIAAGTFVKKP